MKYTDNHIGKSIYPCPLQNFKTSIFPFFIHSAPGIIKELHNIILDTGNLGTEKYNIGNTEIIDNFFRDHCKGESVTQIGVGQSVLAQIGIDINITRHIPLYLHTQSYI